MARRPPHGVKLSRRSSQVPPYYFGRENTVHRGCRVKFNREELGNDATYHRVSCNNERSPSFKVRLMPNQTLRGADRSSQCLKPYAELPGVFRTHRRASKSIAAGREISWRLLINAKIPISVLERPFLIAPQQTAGEWTNSEEIPNCSQARRVRPSKWRSGSSCGPVTTNKPHQSREETQ